jgi:hypothetical protein
MKPTKPAPKSRQTRAKAIAAAPSWADKIAIAQGMNAHPTEVEQLVEDALTLQPLLMDPHPPDTHKTVLPQWKADLQARFAEMYFPALLKGHNDKFEELATVIAAVRGRLSGRIKTQPDPLRLALCSLFPPGKNVFQVKRVHRGKVYGHRAPLKAPATMRELITQLEALAAKARNAHSTAFDGLTILDERHVRRVMRELGISFQKPDK